jgi:antitoxin (DNA-binding transcriptional repressor) of toxin-antitoxin stability system
MKTLTVSEFAAGFMDILPFIQKGEKVKISYGKAKKPVAMLVPILANNKSGTRKIGILEGKASFSEIGDGKIAEKELGIKTS